MKKLRKGIVLTLAVCIALSPILVFGDSVVDKEKKLNTISAPVKGQEIEAEYIKFEGKIANININEDGSSILVKNDHEKDVDESIIVNISEDVILLNDKTMDFIDKQYLKEGMSVSIYYYKHTPMTLSIPPMITPNVIEVNEKDTSVFTYVSKFNDELVSVDNFLNILENEKTIIVDKDGNKYTGVLANRDLIVYYGAATKSIPAQTTPEKIIVMPERKEVKKVVLKDGILKNENGVVMIPLRLVAESLDYKVSWNQEDKSVEIVKGAQWSLVRIGEDKYNFAKMYVELGTAPVLKNSKTYVPLKFAEEILQASVEVLNDGTVIIMQ